jgi:exonuclease SbcC
VLRLLGITPLDAARDLARRDARRATGDHTRLRAMLPDVDALRVEAADIVARAEAATIAAKAEEQAATMAQERRRAAAATLEALDRRRQEHDALVIEGRGVRAELDAANRMVIEQQAELGGLLDAAAQLTAIDREAAGVDRAEGELEVLAAAAVAAANSEQLVLAPEPPALDEATVEAARAAAAEAAQRLAGLVSLTRAAEEEVDRARQVAARSASLSNEADCPLCGQALGNAFEQVQAHRAAELGAAEHRLQQLSPQVAQARRDAKATAGRQNTAVAAAEQARRARSEWEVGARRREELAAARQAAWQAVLTAAPERATAGGRRGGPSAGLPSAALLADEVSHLRADVQHRRAAAREAERLRVRLERRPVLEQSLAAHRERAAHAGGRVQALREKVRDLRFDPEALRQAAAAHEEAVAAAQAAQARAHQADLAAAGERAKQEAAATRLADAIEQHAQLAELESEARHVARAADLLAEFRNTVVAAVGPRLAVQAAELFAELTDHEYDQLQVDPETYQLQITDAGRVYGLDRFSGSEIDLANLSLRVAISEHVHLQSGGSIGLLVLDEVFGPLDEDRKARMLLALERLRGRFRQILVVTHDASIKEQLPNAIEVVKLPGRRATARPMSG